MTDREKGERGLEKVEEGEKIMQKGEEGEKKGEWRPGARGGRKKTMGGRKGEEYPLYHVGSQGLHYKYYMYAP